MFEDLDIRDDPFTLEEFRKVKSSLKVGKAAGPDDIPPEVFTSCDFDEMCLDFCNDVLINNDKPDLWSFMNIIPVPKSGDRSKTDNLKLDGRLLTLKCNYNFLKICGALWA